MTLESALIYEIHPFQLKCMSIYRKEVKIIAITYVLATLSILTTKIAITCWSEAPTPSIGPSLANAIKGNDHYSNYLKYPTVSRLKLEPIDESKTRKWIEHLKNKTSTGIDGVSHKLIKIAVNELVSPLTIVINQMLNTGVFPNQLKISKVIPKYKSKDHTLLSNYRPIALLPSISKIIEYVFLEQLLNYFIQNNLLSSQQYGFSAKHSTEPAALNLVDHLTYTLDSGNIPTNI